MMKELAENEKKCQMPINVYSFKDENHREG